jgi:poly-gamma-glutamate synthesis protein (capsule biosynthesis protein)
VEADILAEAEPVDGGEEESKSLRVLKSSSLRVLESTSLPQDWKGEGYITKSKMLKYSVLYIHLFLLACISGIKAYAGSSMADTSRLTLIFTGDIMGHDAQISSAFNEKTGRYDYSFCFSELKSFIRDADIAIGNLEVTLAGEPYKGYPRFSSPDELADALKDAGFDILVNANNHALDGSKEGLERTIDIVSEKGLIITGTFKSEADRETRYPLLVEKNNILIAILNYTYGSNGLTTVPPNFVNYIDTLLISNDIQKVRKVNPDFIIACMHWGNEYELDGSYTQRLLARFLAREGVDAIIGSHPHVVQPFEIIYNGADSADFIPVVYSLGNFISNQRERYRNGGIIFRLDLIKTERTLPASCSYMPVWVQKPVISGKTMFRLIPASLDDNEKATLKLTEEELTKAEEFCEDTRRQLPNVREF